MSPYLPNGDWDYGPAVDRLINGGPPPAPRPLPPRPLPAHLRPATTITARQARHDHATVTRLARARTALARITRRTAA